MRGRLITGLAFLMTVLACEPVDPADGAFAAPELKREQDLDGMPDLIVDRHAIATSWVIYDQELRESFCSLAEAGITPGRHRVLRMTVTTPNIGDADLYVGDPTSHIDPDGDGDISDSDGLFEFAECHGHLHYRNYATYELLSPSGDVWLSSKTGFCMLDVQPWNSGNGGVGPWYYRSCGTPPHDGFPGSPGNQGISVGYADTYDKWLFGQYFVLDGGGGQPVVPPGDYVIRVYVNPPFVCGANDGDKPTDGAGLCHNFAESNYDNNVAEVPITIPNHPGKKGYGPGGGQFPQDEIVDDENRPAHK